MNRRCGAYTLVLLSACSSNRPPIGGIGVDAGPVQANGGWMDGGTDASADGGADASADAGKPFLGAPHHPIDNRPLSQRAEEDEGLKLTDEEKIIVDTCPPRQWSKNVPDRACTRDNECGDGFCDRGKCRAIKTCLYEYGSPCNDRGFCSGVCFEGRCRSCVSDEECQQKFQKVNPELARRYKASCVPNGVGDGIPTMCY